MSIAGGVPRAIERALSVDATALQIFVKNNNQWRAKPFADGEPETFRRAVADAGLGDALIAHASYLINVASPDDALWNKSIEALAVELRRCAELGVPGLVLHPGSHVGQGVEAGLERAAAGLDRALELADGPTRILLEITAGQGSNLGCSFEQLAGILDQVAVRGGYAVCFDTCHALAAGYEFRDAESYAETFDALDRAVGLDSIAAFHLNDSKMPLGSRRDRHEHIGKGELGLEPFRLLLNDPRFEQVPMVLETPKGKDLEDDRVNLATLRGLIAS